jgi:hypothetical protein
MIAQASADDIVAALVTGPARILAATKPLNAARAAAHERQATAQLRPSGLAIAFVHSYICLED